MRLAGGNLEKPTARVSLAQPRFSRALLRILAIALYITILFSCPIFRHSRMLVSGIQRLLFAQRYCMPPFIYFGFGGSGKLSCIVFRTGSTSFPNVGVLLSWKSHATGNTAVAIDQSLNVKKSCIRIPQKSE